MVCFVELKNISPIKDNMKQKLNQESKLLGRNVNRRRSDRMLWKLVNTDSEAM